MSVALIAAAAMVTLPAQVACAAPTGILVGAWSFDEPSGSTVADASGQGNTGSVSGAVRVAGKYGRALSFDGVDDHVTVADSPSLDLTGALTLEAWVRPSQVSGSRRTVAFKDRSTQLAYALYAGDGGGRSSGHVFTSRDAGVTAPSALPLNSWTHLATTYDGAYQRLYINGTRVARTALTGSVRTSGNPLHFGGNQVWSEWFHGALDEIRIYNGALTAQQIRRDSSTPIGTPPPAPTPTPSPTPAPTPAPTPTPAPSPTPAPAPTPTPTATPTPGWTATIDNPVPPGSFWAETIAQHGVTVDPNSASMISYWLSHLAAGDTGSLGLRKWGYTVRMTTGSDPTYSIQSSCQWTCNLDRFGPVPIPLGMQPSPDADAHMSVLSPSGKTWGMWHASWTGSTWTAGCGEAINLATENLVPATCGATNGNIPQPIIGLTPRDIQRGVIDHPLAFSSPGLDSLHDRCPTLGNPGGGSAGLPDGTLLQLDPAYNVDGSNLSSWEKTVAHALQTYGMFVVDNSGNLQLSTEVPEPGRENQWATLLGWTGDYQYFGGGFPWSRMRVMTAPC